MNAAVGSVAGGAIYASLHIVRRIVHIILFRCVSVVVWITVSQSFIIHIVLQMKYCLRVPYFLFLRCRRFVIITQLLCENETCIKYKKVT